jgi:hypothetical protein
LIKVSSLATEKKKLTGQHKKHTRKMKVLKKGSAGQSVESPAGTSSGDSAVPVGE